MDRWRIRWPFVGRVSAALVWLGLWLMFLGGPWLPPCDHLYTRWCMLAPIVLWSVTSDMLTRADFRLCACPGYLGGDHYRKKARLKGMCHLLA